MKELDTLYPISVANVASFHRRGYLKLRGVLTRRTLRDLGDEFDASLGNLTNSRTKSKPFIQQFNLWVDSPRIRQLTLSVRLGHIATRLLGVKGVRLIHDQALLKEPGDNRTIWHTDQHHWPIGQAKACTVWIPLQSTPVRMGSLSFAVRSHLPPQVRTGNGTFVLERDQVFDRLLRRRYRITEEDFSIGDISIHDGRIFHQAGRNVTNRCRRTLVIHMMDSTARVTGAKNAAQREHIRRFFWSALTVGQVLDVPMCPLVFPRLPALIS